MRKNCNRILALLLACVLTFAMAGQALAADTTPQAAEAAQAAVLTQANDATSPALFSMSNSGYLKLNKPKNKAVYYKGETIPVSITIADLDDEMLFCTAMVIANEKTEETVWLDYTFDDGLTYKTKVNTKKFPAGTYILGAGVSDIPLDKDEDPLLDIDETMVYAEFTLKTLKAPTSLKAAAGKRKVTTKKPPAPPSMRFTAPPRSPRATRRSPPPPRPSMWTPRRRRAKSTTTRCAPSAPAAAPSTAPTPAPSARAR